MQTAAYTHCTPQRNPQGNKRTTPSFSGIPDLPVYLYTKKFKNITGRMINEFFLLLPPHQKKC
jgi:hypothetical protein